MILSQDNFLPQRAFEGLQKECIESEFKEIKAGEKGFLCTKTPRWLFEYLKVEGHRIIFTFIRKAHKDFDTDLRIHNDSIINGARPVLASVLYINPSEGATPNGTAFWNHDVYGYKAPDNIDSEEFDRLLNKDANNKKKWRKTSYIESRPNRLLLYDASYFHSKYPMVIQEGERIVCVAFYEKID